MPKVESAVATGLVPTEVQPDEHAENREVEEPPAARTARRERAGREVGAQESRGENEVGELRGPTENPEEIRPDRHEEAPKG